MENEDDDINKIKKRVTHYLTKEKTIDEKFTGKKQQRNQH